MRTSHNEIIWECDILILKKLVGDRRPLLIMQKKDPDCQLTIGI